MSRILRIILVAFFAILGALVIYNIWNVLRPPENVSFATVCQRHDTDVWIEGYLDFVPDSVVHSPGYPGVKGRNRAYDDFELHSVPGATTDEAFVLASIRANPASFGNPTNAICVVRSNYGNDDFVLYTDSGETLTKQDKVKILGTIYFHKEETDPATGKVAKTCALSAKKILRAED